MDNDCPLEDPFDVWFEAAAARVGEDRKKLTVEAFLDKIPTSKVDLAWTPGLAETAGSALLSRGTVRARLQSLHRNDPAFRASVDAMLRDEGYMREAASKERAGACTEQKVCRRSVTAPTMAIYDGTSRVTFQRSAATAGVSYVREGEGTVHEVPAVSCDASDAPAACRDVSVPDVDADDMAPTLQDHPKASQYRVHFHNRGLHERYLVQNAVQAYGTLDARTAREECAVQLCARNADSCPAPHCRVDGDGACVPDATRIDAVGLR